jgi:hypothetical protein
MLEKLSSPPQAEHAHRRRAKIQFLEVHAHAPSAPDVMQTLPQNGRRFTSSRPQDLQAGPHPL